MGASKHWYVGNQMDHFHTIFSFRRANQIDRIGGMCVKGIFHWVINVNQLESWVNEGGFIIDDNDHEYSLDEFIASIEQRCQIILDDYEMRGVVVQPYAE